jgi:type II secretory ATPase GspE/PulE/Tfp pilus assembly ATPase PilB-like protein
VVAQRLVRTVCSACRQFYEPLPEEIQSVGLSGVPPGTRIARAPGCTACHGSGFKGRVAVREILEIDDAMRAMIARRAPIDEIRTAALAGGFKTMRFHALRLWLAGTTTTRELIRVTRA